MENVTGIDQMGVREQILRDLMLDGEYKVAAQVVDAADFGVPQTRKRLLFFGLHRSFGINLPLLSGSSATEYISLQRQNGNGVRYSIQIVPKSLAAGVAASLADPEDASAVTVAQAISDLAGLPVGHRKDELAYEALPAPQSAYQRVMRDGAGEVLTNVQVPRINEDTRLRLEGLPSGGNYRDLPEELTERYLTGQRWGQNNGSGMLSRQHFYAYRKLHRDIWAWTLNTKADAAYHYGVPRALSVREFARLQSFPDTFVFTTDPRRGAIANRIDGGPAHSRYRQAGNAVPPLLARAAAQSLATVLAEAPRKFKTA
jgi:DNA (cytosine-5)-methyltransferase 1